MTILSLALTRDRIVESENVVLPENHSRTTQQRGRFSFVDKLPIHVTFGVWTRDELDLAFLVLKHTVLREDEFARQLDILRSTWKPHSVKEEKEE